MFLLTPFEFPLSNSVREGEQLNKTTFASPFSFFYSPPFYSPFLIELERENNSKKIIRIVPFFFKRKGKGRHSRFD